MKVSNAGCGDGNPMKFRRNAAGWIFPVAAAFLALLISAAFLPSCSRNAGPGDTNAADPLYARSQSVSLETAIADERGFDVQNSHADAKTVAMLKNELECALRARFLALGGKRIVSTPPTGASAILDKGAYNTQ